MTRTAGQRTARATESSRPTQPTLPFRPGHGGKRLGAGRKPKGQQAGVSHASRAPLAARFPVHVTAKLREHLPALRRKDAYQALRQAFASGCDRNGFRLVHYAVLNDHLHFVVEATGRTALTRGVQGLLVRLARALNRLWGRRGRVFADRFHDRILKSPREVRNVLVYVLGNARHHAAAGRMVTTPQPIDLFSSAPWFDGFREAVVVRNLPDRPVTDARTWLLTFGWRRHGLLSVTAAPA
jgi:REP element-mobilizing transposase RayT